MGAGGGVSVWGPLRRGLLGAVGFAAGACGGAVVAPEPRVESPVEVIPEPLPSGPFSALLALPLTLQYVDDDGRGVACQLSDAGISGVTRAFKVACEGSPAGATATTTSGGRCASSYLGGADDARGSHRAWRTGGCYVVAPEGLWHFAVCPATRGALSDLKGAGGELVLSADALPAGSTPGSGEVRRGAVALDGAGEVATVCVASEDAGMMKAVHTRVCTSPVYAYLEASVAVDEMELAQCRETSRLVAVEPGARSPRTCLLEPLVVGRWAVTARTWVAGGAAGKTMHGRVGGLAHYEVVVTKDAACGLSADVKKVGEGKKRYAPKAVSSGVAPVALGCDAATWGHACFTTKVRLQGAGGASEEVTLALAIPRDPARGPMLTGYWSDGGGASGLLQGDGLGDDEGSGFAGFDTSIVPRAEHCEAVAARTGPKGRVVDLDTFQACLHEGAP